GSHHGHRRIRPDAQYVAQDPAAECQACRCDGSRRLDERIINMADDAFLGQWEMDPAENRYEAGQPPQSGGYTIVRDGADYRFFMTWTNAEGQPFEMEYRTTPDGVAYSYENPAVADTIKTTRVDAYT